MKFPFFGSNIDWKKSKAHLLLLSYFLNPREEKEFVEKGYWDGALKESVTKAIDRFIKEGILANQDLRGLLAFKFKVPDLKELLKKKKLPISGKKEILISRLIESNADEMKKLVKGLKVLNCAEAGKEIASKFIIEEDQKKAEINKRVIDALKARNFEEASKLVIAFEAQQVFPRGIGIDWNVMPPSWFVPGLENMLNGFPKILSRFRISNLEDVRIAAAMCHLWGVGNPNEWLPRYLEDFDDQTAVRMIEFFGIKNERLKSYMKLGRDKVIIQSNRDSCTACKELEGKIFEIKDAPEIPYEHCTHAIGCRCDFYPYLPELRDNACE